MMNQKHLTKTIVLTTALSVLGACSSATNLTGAKTQKEGEYELLLGASYSGNLVRNSETSTSTLGIDFAGRYGMTNEDEVGLSYRNSGQTVLDYKRSLIDDSDMALAVGAGIGYLSVTVLEASTTYMDFFVPIYYDYKLDDETTLLASAKYLMSRASGEGFSTTSNNLGLAAGARFGKNSGFHAEFGYLMSFEEGASNAWQTSLGYFW